MSTSAQKGNQSSSSSGQTSSTSQTDQSGNSYGTTAGNTTVNPTAAWGTTNGILGSNLGTSGLTPQQAAAMGFFSGTSGNPYDANSTANRMNWGGDVLSQYTTGANNQANTAAPTSTVGTGTITAPTGASLMGAYQNPYTQQVVNATAADAGQALNTGLNSIAAQFGGQYGNSGQGVAAGQAVGDFTRGLTSNIAGLRSQGFNTAMQGGAQDASNALSANTSNAGNALIASGQNAANTQQNNQFNAGQQDVNANRVIGTTQDWIGNLGTQNGIVSNAATNAYGTSGGGLSQLMQYLNAQVPAFGQSQTGTQTGSTTGTSKTDASGQYSGNTSGSSSSKGGGASAGDVAKLFICWVAREVYGHDNPKWLEFRQWMLTNSPKWFLALYLRYGEQFAAWISNKPRIKAAIRWQMDRVTK